MTAPQVIGPGAWNASSRSPFRHRNLHGLPGKMVSLEETLSGCQRILNDEFALERWPERPGVGKILVETSQGLLGILPRYRDCLVAVAPGILTVEAESC